MAKLVVEPELVLHQFEIWAPRHSPVVFDSARWGLVARQKHLQVHFGLAEYHTMLRKRSAAVDSGNCTTL